MNTDLLRARDAGLLHRDASLIEMLKGGVDTEQRLHQRDVQLQVQVVALSDVREVQRSHLEETTRHVTGR